MRDYSSYATRTAAEEDTKQIVLNEIEILKNVLRRTRLGLRR